MQIDNYYIVMEKLILREALKSDMSWINSQYRLIEFKESDYDNELIVIAEYDGIPGGIGRLQNIDNINAELGGIYVLPKFRGLKIAREIVSYLLKNSKNYKTVYCLPFSHLNRFYESMGFEPVKDFKTVPCKIKEKHSWCETTYKNETPLYHRSN